MKEITVNKDELLERLTANRSKHREVFEAATEGFRIQAIKNLNALVREIKAGRLPSLYIDLDVPEDHTRDYDRVIEMIRMHTGEDITITEQDAASFIMDDWGWKRQFISASSIYAAESVSKNYG